MLRLLLKSLLLAALTACVLILIAAVPGWRFRFSNSQTDSNLFVMPEHSHVDFVMLGTSHGRIFSRVGNHERVEAILGKTFLNLSKSGGRGVYAARLYQEYFFHLGNRTDAIVYFIDPWAVLSRVWNEDNDLFYDEPLDLRFMAFLVGRPGLQWSTWLNYGKSKLTASWLLQEPKPPTGDRQQVSMEPEERAESARQRLRVLYAYQDGVDEAAFSRYAKDLEAMTAEARAHGARMIFILPPTLLGELPGTDLLLRHLRELEVRYGAEVHDTSFAITDPSLYADVDHLNTNGVVYYTKTFLTNVFLQPLLDASK